MMCGLGVVLVLMLGARAGVQSGFVGVQRDHVVDRTDSPSSSGFREDSDLLGRELLPGTKDMVIPLLTGVLVKVLTLLPLILTTLALIAGFSLAASKVALLLGSGLMLYHYISETQLFLPVANKGVPYYPESTSFHPPGHFQHPELPEYIRDRTLNIHPSVDT